MTNSDLTFDVRFVSSRSVEHSGTNYKYKLINVMLFKIL